MWAFRAGNPYMQVSWTRLVWLDSRDDDGIMNVELNPTAPDNWAVTPDETTLRTNGA